MQTLTTSWLQQGWRVWAHDEDGAVVSMSRDPA